MDRFRSIHNKGLTSKCDIYSLLIHSFAKHFIYLHTTLLDGMKYTIFGMQSAEKKLPLKYGVKTHTEDVTVSTCFDAYSEEL